MFERGGKHERSNSSYSSYNDSYLCESDKGGSQKDKKDFFDWVDVIAVSLVAVIVIFTFFVRVATINGISMENTFHDGEKVIVSGLNYTPKQGDVVIVSRNYYNNPYIDTDDRDYQPIIKRVIATENQTVRIYNGIVEVDGTVLKEDYIKDSAETRINQYDSDYAEQYEKGVTVPKGCVFVLGDNRENSHDSRAPEIGNRGNGMIDREYIIGKVLFRVFPFNAIGGVY